MLWGKKKSEGFSLKQEDEFLEIVARGYKLYDQGQLTQAKQEFHRAADQGWPGAWIGIAECFKAENNIPETLNAAHKVLDCAGDIYLEHAAAAVVFILGPLYLAENVRESQINGDNLDLAKVEKNAYRGLQTLNWVEGLEGVIDLNLVVSAKKVLCDYYRLYSIRGEVGRPHWGRWVACNYFVAQNGKPEESQAAKEAIIKMVRVVWDGKIPASLAISDEGMEALKALNLDSEVSMETKVPLPEENTSLSHSSDYKTCPYCAEEVKAAAIKCRYCGESI